MTDRQKSCKTSPSSSPSYARSLLPLLHLCRSSAETDTLILASCFSCALFYFSVFVLQHFFFYFLALSRVLCPAVTLLPPLTLPFSRSLPPSSSSFDLILLPPLCSVFAPATYFVQCRRVLLVPRALLTLSLLPLTV